MGGKGLVSEVSLHKRWGVLFSRRAVESDHMPLQVSSAVNSMVANSGDLLSSASSCATSSATTADYVKTSSLAAACALASSTDSSRYRYDIVSGTLSGYDDKIKPAVLTAIADRMQQAFNTLPVVPTLQDMTTVMVVLCRWLFVDACAAGDANRLAFFEQRYDDTVRAAANTVFKGTTEADLATFDSWKAMWKKKFCDAMPSLDLMAGQLKLDETQVVNKSALLSALLEVTHAPYVLYMYQVANLSQHKADFQVARCSSLAAWLSFAHIFEFFKDKVSSSDDQGLITSRFKDILTAVNASLVPEDSTGAALNDAAKQSDANTTLLTDMNTTGGLLIGQQNTNVMARRSARMAKRRRRINLIVLIVWTVAALAATAVLVKKATDETASVVALTLAFSTIVLVLIFLMRRRA